MALAERASARVLGVYEWGLAAKTKKANAALTGIAGTRRILVSDTMLADYTEDEIEVVLAHELAHHVHGDIWKGIDLRERADRRRILRERARSPRLGRMAWPQRARGRRRPSASSADGWRGVARDGSGRARDVAPLRTASADRFALKLTRNPTAFISAMRRLAAQNLAEEHPSKIVEWLFYSHPPIRERVAAAQEFKDVSALSSAHLTGCG